MFVSNSKLNQMKNKWLAREQKLHIDRENKSRERESTIMIIQQDNGDHKLRKTEEPSGGESLTI